MQVALIKWARYVMSLMVTNLWKYIRVLLTVLVGCLYSFNLRAANESYARYKDFTSIKRSDHPEIETCQDALLKLGIIEHTSRRDPNKVTEGEDDSLESASAAYDEYDQHETTQLIKRATGFESWANLYEPWAAFNINNQNYVVRRTNKGIIQVFRGKDKNPLKTINYSAEFQSIPSPKEQKWEYRIYQDERAQIVFEMKTGDHKFTYILLTKSEY